MTFRMTPFEKGRRQGLREARAIVRVALGCAKADGDMNVLAAARAMIDLINVGLRPKVRGISIRSRK